MRSFCSAKASLIFSTKNISVFGYKVITHLSWPLNKLVKLTMLWITGPWSFCRLFSQGFIKGLADILCKTVTRYCSFLCDAFGNCYSVMFFSLWCIWFNGQWTPYLLKTSDLILEVTVYTSWVYFQVSILQLRKIKLKISSLKYTFNCKIWYPFYGIWYMD